MPRSFRAAAALALLAALASCSYAVAVRAFFLGGRLAFAPSEPRPEPWCLGDFFVADESGRTVWAFERPPEARASGPCRDWPLVYGQASPGARTLVRPTALVPGRLYVLGGWDGDSLEGAFRLHRVGAGAQIEIVDAASSAARDALERRRPTEEAADRAEAERKARERVRPDPEPAILFNDARPLAAEPGR